MNDASGPIVPNAARQVASSGEYAERLGYLVTNFAEVEYLCAQLVWLLLSPKDLDKGRLVTYRQSFRRVLDLLGGLLVHTTPSIAQTASVLIKKADHLRVERNKMVHSIWTSAGLDEKGDVVRGRLEIVRRDGGFDLDRSGIQLDEIRGLSNEIADLVLQLDELTDQVKELVWSTDT